jgi:hypothetical protein
LRQFKSKEVLLKVNRLLVGQLPALQTAIPCFINGDSIFNGFPDIFFGLM